jgi:hypothetical protein
MLMIIRGALFAAAFGGSTTPRAPDDLNAPAASPDLIAAAPSV